MKSDKVYLTFPTDRATSEILKIIAHGYKMSQPELIEMICKQYIEDLDKIAEEYLKKEGIIEQ